MKITKLLYICSVGFAVILIAMGAYLRHITNPSRSDVPDLGDSKYFIAHAMGSMDGYIYLNCKESLLKSLQNGYKYIEIDLQYTSDSVLVCAHNWEQFNKISIPDITGNDSNKFMRIPSFEEFKNRKIYGKYTPLSLTDVIALQNKEPFVIVIDKTCDANVLNRYFRKEQRKNVMVEVFSENDYSKIKSSGYIPMLSIGCMERYDCMLFIAKHLFTHDYEWFAVEYHSDIRCLRLLKKLYNANIAVYTVNSQKYFSWYLGKGIDLIYTDNWDLKKQINTFQDNNTH